MKDLADKWLLRITERSDALSANNLGFENKFSGKSFIYIKKSNGPRIEPWGTSASAFVHVEYWSLRTTLYFLSLRKLVKVSSKSPATRFCFNL